MAEVEERRTHPARSEGDRELDVVALKALAHPLRVEIFDVLSTYGCFTASGLAERLGESSGATSYHLRQLEKHGFVREVDGKGTSRERWWERVPGGVNIGSKDAVETPAGRSAATMIFRQLRMNDDRLVNDFVEDSHDLLTTDWQDASAISTFNTRLTSEQLADFVRQVTELADKIVGPNKNQTTAGSRPVHIVFQAFPVVDAEESTGDAETKQSHKNP